MSRPLQIVHLYPRDMNIYGDTGNRIVLEKRLEWRSIPFETHHVNIGDTLPKNVDLIIGGGGQDAGQQKVEVDLLRRGDTLKAMAEDGVVMLMICGLYQLFGQAFITSNDETIKGIGVLPLFTQASSDRIIGNIAIDTDWGELVGYENHSGRTWLQEGCSPLGKVVKGGGNNAEDATEGARFINVFGSYLHGPLLSKNPQFADMLLGLALQHMGDSATLSPLNDSLERRAAEVASQRPR